MDTCIACGSDQLSIGTIGHTSYGLLTHKVSMKFYPENGRNKIDLNAIVCLNCGHVEIILDPRILNKLHK